MFFFICYFLFVYKLESFKSFFFVPFLIFPGNMLWRVFFNSIEKFMSFGTDSLYYYFNLLHSSFNRNFF